MRNAVLSAVLFAALLGVSQAWWCTGHMTICQIAKWNMGSTALGTVESIVESLSQSGPFPKSPDFVQTGCWADDLKGYGLEAMAQWHFVNQPYDPSNYPIAKWPIQVENVETLVTQLDETARKSGAVTWDLNFAVGNLIHFFGDIHQPLHVTELFSSTYPDGDRGGNLQNVIAPDGTQTKLHFIWDSICWQYSTDPDRPLNSAGLQVIENLANRLTSTYSFSDADKKVWNSTIMAQEGYALAVSTAYPGTYNGMQISQAYITSCIPVAEARVTLAGYRLGNELEYLFKDGVSDKSKKAREIQDRLTVARTDLHRARRSMQREVAQRFALKKQ